MQVPYLRGKGESRGRGFPHSKETRNEGLLPPSFGITIDLVMVCGHSAPSVLHGRSPYISTVATMQRRE